MQKKKKLNEFSYLTNITNIILSNKSREQSITWKRNDKLKKRFLAKFDRFICQGLYYDIFQLRIMIFFSYVILGETWKQFLHFIKGTAHFKGDITSADPKHPLPSRVLLSGQ